MGSPLGLKFANLFLVYYEHRWLGNCPLQFKLKFCCRYVDDMFLILEKNHVIEFLKYMNTRHGNVKFTVEKGIR